MKIRNGFVSNSSSSSFIVGISKIINKEKFDQYISINGIDINNYEITVSSFKDIKEKINYNCIFFNNKIIINSFINNVYISTDNLNNEDLIFYVSIANDEGDYAFSDDGCDIDYDINLSFFDSTQQNIYNMFYNKESGLDINNSDASYGAGRNG